VRYRAGRVAQRLYQPRQPRLCLRLPQCGVKCQVGFGPLRDICGCQHFVMQFFRRCEIGVTNAGHGFGHHHRFQHLAQTIDFLDIAQRQSTHHRTAMSIENTSPSEISVRKASRIGVVLTSSRLARSSWRKCSPAARRPCRISVRKVCTAY